MYNQALVDLFRQSFSPLVQLGQGRLAMTQAALERDYNSRERSARRQQAMEDHVAGIRLQNELALARDRQNDAAANTRADIATQRAIELQELNANSDFVRSMAAAGAGQAGNAKLAREARAATELARARELAANLGIDDVDPTEPDFVDQVMKKAAVVNAKHRGSATQIYKDLAAIDTQLGTLAKDVDVPEAHMIRIARPILLANADPKQKDAFKKLNSIDAIMDVAEAGVGEKITAAIQTEQKIRLAGLERKARPLQSRQVQLQRTLQTLEGKGISPDYEALKGAVGTSVAPEEEESSGGLSADDLGALFPVAPAPQQPTVGVPSAGDALTIATGAGLSALSHPTARAATARFIGGSVGRIIPAAAGLAKLAGRAVPLVGPGLTGYGIGNFANRLTNNFVPNSIAGISPSPSAEAARQHEKLATIQALLSRVDPDVAARLRALRYAPVINDDAIAGALGQAGEGGWLGSY